MTAKSMYPGLDEEGWTNNPNAVADRLFADFMLSEASQTFAFPGDVSSYPELLQKYRHEPVKLCAEIDFALTRLFGRYFTGVSCTSTVLDSGQEIKTDIAILLEYTDSTGLTHNLDQVLKQESGALAEYSNNYKGEPA